MAKFHPFLLNIELDDPGQLNVEAQFMGLRRRHAMAWEDLPLSPDELKNAGSWLEHGHIDRSAAYDLGRHLSEMVFQGEILSLLEEAEGYLGQDEGLRLMLQLPSISDSSPSPTQLERARLLHALPWELMQSYRGKHGFFAQSRQVALARHDSQANLPNHPPNNRHTLRILIIDASTTGAVPLQDQAEITTIRRALHGAGGLMHRLKIIHRHLTNEGSLKDLPAQLWNVRRFSLTVLSEASPVNVEREVALARAAGQPFHVIHFIGHGESDGGGGALFLDGEGEDQPAVRVAADDFLNLIVNPDLNLLVINACESAAVGDPVESIAQRALIRGVPVVIGMRIEVFDQAAVFLARDFYTALAAGEPIESALARARLLTVRETRGKEIDWSIPLLFMGWSEGLTLPPMKRQPFTWLERVAALIVAVVSFMGITGSLMDAPAWARQAATTVPGIKCLALQDMDENKFTVAFYNFAVVDENGRMVFTNDGRDLAAFLYNRFEHNFAEMDLQIPYELRPPAHTCAIYGKDERIRADRAAKLARAINADVIIYGTIVNAKTDPRLKLEFYVANDSFAEGDEIIGSHALGGLLKVNRPFEPDELLFINRPAHVVRTDILNQVIFGLSYFSVDDYELAAGFFQKALEMKGWPDTDGKEVVHLMLGNALIRQAAQVNDPALLDEAERHYKKALEMAPDQIRAVLGLASVVQSRAVGDMQAVDPKSYDEALLAQAEQLYLDALQMAKEADSGREEASDALQDVQTKVDFGIGQIYYNRWLRDGGKPWEEAFNRLTAVVNAHNSGLVYQPYRAGRAYGYLAHIERQRHDLAKAAEDYDQAIKLSSPVWQVFYSCRYAQLYCSEEKEVEAAKMLQAAIDTARLHGYSSLVDYYTPRLAQLSSNGCFEYQCPAVLTEE